MMNLMLAEQYYKKGRYKEALRVYEVILKENPKDSLAYQGLAQCLLQENRLNEALDASKMALELDNKLTQPLLTLANIYVKQDRLEDALATTQKALNLNSTDENVFIAFSAIYNKKNQINHSISNLHKAISLNNSSWVAHFNLGLAYVNQNSSRKALREFWLAFIIKPSKNTLYMLLAAFIDVYYIHLSILNGILFAIALIMHSVYAIPMVAFISMYFLAQSYLMFRSKNNSKMLINILLAIFIFGMYMIYVFRLHSIF